MLSTQNLTAELNFCCCHFFWKKGKQVDIGVLSVEALHAKNLIFHIPMPNFKVNCNSNSMGCMFSYSKTSAPSCLPQYPETSRVIIFFSQHVFESIPPLRKNIKFWAEWDSVKSSLGMWSEMKARKKAFAAFVFVLNNVLFSLYRVP